MIRFSVPSLILLFALAARADHDPRYAVPDPVSVPEAWNVITQSMKNIDVCLATNQVREVSFHVSNCSPAIRVLQAAAEKPLRDELEKLFATGDAIVAAVQQNDVAKAKTAYQKHNAVVDAVAKQYKPDVVNAAVYVCVHHPTERSTDKTVKCAKCNMALIPRRIRASVTFEKPGEPTMKLALRPNKPLKIGEKASVTMTLKTNAGQPVTRRDLLTVHTEKIHLLIVDASLSDYHHEHPQPTDTPGEYTFSFTPQKPGPYRVFADVVAVESSVQEYVIADLPGDSAGGAIQNKQPTVTSEVDGFVFNMKLDTKDANIPANHPISGAITINAPDGLPFKELEPIMGAFAHLVAFHEDGKTVLHIHPEGPEPTKAEERGGPKLSWKFFAPVPGFYRLYAQIQVAGEQKFAPFNIVVIKP